MKNIIIFSVFSIVFHTLIICQDKQTQFNADSLNQNSSNYNIPSKKSLINSIQRTDPSLMEDHFQIFKMDSLKYIYELSLVNSLIRSNYNVFEYFPKMVEHKKSIDLILVPYLQYYKNQPKYDLGKLSEYLGISKKILALLLGIISL